MKNKSMILENGVTLVTNIYNGSDVSVSLTFGCGHLNETKLGVASVFEKIVQRAAGEKIVSMYGGSFTSFYTGAKQEKFTERMQQLNDWCIDLKITDEMLVVAVADIVQHTRDLAPLPERQAKLIYKHTAFGKNKVAWNTSEYIAALNSLTVQDVLDYRKAGLVGNNMVVVYSGPLHLVDDFVSLAKFFFGNLPKGRRRKIDNLLYTGGYQVVEGNGDQIVFLGWDISTIRSRVEANLLMSMLNTRLERAYADLPAKPEVKVAGYYGFNTLRLGVRCSDPTKFAECVDILCANIQRACSQRASDRRMETTRQRAMTERLLEASKAQPTAVRIAWQLLGRDSFYSPDEWLNSVWQVDAYDVRDTAREIFGSPMTCVIYANYKDAVPSFDDIKKKLQY